MKKLLSVNSSKYKRFSYFVLDIYKFWNYNFKYAKEMDFTTTSINEK